MTDAILFDLDGTLIDSAPAICGGLRAALIAVGSPVPDEAALRGCIGLPLVHVWQRLGLSTDRHEAAVAGYRAWALGHDSIPVRPFAGVPDMLAGLHAEGRLLVLASAKDTASARRALVSQGWEGLFHAVSGAEPGDGPDKCALVRRGLAMLPPGTSACMVGDMTLDADAALANGIPFIACTWGCGTRADLASRPHAVMVDDVPALHRVLA